VEPSLSAVDELHSVSQLALVFFAFGTMKCDISAPDCRGCTNSAKRRIGKLWKSPGHVGTAAKHVWEYLSDNNSDSGLDTP
jgi:hypothetical protein